MPRKAKEKIDVIEKDNVKKNVEKKPANRKKAVSRKSTLARIIENAANEAFQEKSEITSGVKATIKKGSAKKTTSKKSDNKKVTAKKTTSKKSDTKKIEKAIQILEYYDLPYKYGNTVVRLLAQTPKTLFVYWEVSNSDIDIFKKEYGEDFFSKTKPVLIVHNLTLNKTSEIEINDFANCWYLNTDDTDCKFDIELARKFINPSKHNSEDDSEYLYVAQSNNLQSPNDHILFEKIKEFVVFKDVSTNRKIKKDIKSFKFLNDIYKFYKDMYDEDILNNPSSQFNFQ